MTTSRNWNIYSKMLEDRGRISLFFTGVPENEFVDLKKMNQDKVGRPFKFTNLLITAVFATKCVLRFGYRQIHSFVDDLSGRFGISSVPNFRTIQWRISKLKKEGTKFNIIQHKNNLFVVAIDSTEIKRCNDGEYRTMMYDKRKEWIKLHIVVDTATGKILNSKVTKSRVHDSREFCSLLKPFKKNVSKILADKGYDSETNFKFCDDNKIIAGIPVRFNSSRKCGGRRRDAVVEQFGLPIGNGSHNRFFKNDRSLKQKEWKERTGYGYRWRVEGTFGNFKRMFGEYIFSKKKEIIEREISAKISVYNSFLG